jgi:hypothetical protein
MTAKELTQPRFEVIETYPKSKFKKGDILERIPNATNDWYNADKSLNADILLEEIEHYPHLFRKMNDNLNTNASNEAQSQPFFLGAVISRLFHNIGIHNWKFRFTTGHNRYYECSVCKKRDVVCPQGGYQPIDRNW